MATTAWPALGITITYNSLAIGQVLSVTGAGGGSVGERDTTNLGSTVKTNAPTIPDNGEFSFSVNWDPTDSGHIALRNGKDTPTVETIVVSFPTTPTAKTATFSGWVKELEGINGEGVDENLVADVTIRVTGAVTWS